MRDTFVLSLSGPLGMQEQSADLRKEAVSTFLPLAFQCLVSKCVIYTDHHRPQMILLELVSRMCFISFEDICPH